LSILFSEGIIKMRIDLAQFVALAATNRATTFDMYQRNGSIAIGADGDVVFWDPTVSCRIAQAGLHDGSDYTPYEGL